MLLRRRFISSFYSFNNKILLKERRK
jgi:hypothetical protein